MSFIMLLLCIRSYADDSIMDIVSEDDLNVYNAETGEEALLLDQVADGYVQAEPENSVTSDSAGGGVDDSEEYVVVLTPEPTPTPSPEPTPTPTLEPTPTPTLEPISSPDVTPDMSQYLTTNDLAELLLALVDDDEEAETSTDSPVETDEPAEEILEDESDATPSPVPSDDDEIIDATEETETMSFEEELLTSMGYLEGFLLFFVVVILCYFTYKFFRMFF